MIKKILENKKLILLIGGVIIIIVLTIVIALIIAKSNNKNKIGYEDIESIVNNKQDVLIFYYNSKSDNKYNIKVREYLTKERIKYFEYNDAIVSDNEYNKFTTLLGIDKSLFKPPALIYIKKGKMNGNIINIDSIQVVQNFVKNYDLYTLR